VFVFSFFSPPFLFLLSISFFPFPYFIASGNKGYKVEVGAFSDNDGLAALVATNLKVKMK
jgi:hypothetical protein